MKQQMNENLPYSKLVPNKFLTLDRKKTGHCTGDDRQAQFLYHVCLITYLMVGSHALALFKLPTNSHVISLSTFVFLLPFQFCKY